MSGFVTDFRQVFCCLVYFKVQLLASKLRTFDRSGQSSGDAGENENLAESAPDTSLSFEQRLQLQEREMQILCLNTKLVGSLPK